MNIDFDLQGFGMTETSGVVSVTINQPDRSDYGSAGELVSSMEARIVDVTTGENQPPHGQGEIWVRGPTLMQGEHFPLTPALPRVPFWLNGRCRSPFRLEHKWKKRPILQIDSLVISAGWRLLRLLRLIICSRHSGMVKVIV